MEKNPCDMCRPYDHPGFVVNAHQVVACWQCNPGNKKGLPVPRPANLKPGAVHPVFEQIFEDFGLRKP